MAAYNTQKVLTVHHWTDAYFSFTCTRDESLRFENGQFVMIGVMGDNGKPIMRAYSIASPNWEEHLEFFSIKVQDGPLTSRLQHIQVGDDILINRKFEKPIAVQIKAINIQMLNGLPKTKDKSDSFYRRLIIVPFSYFSKITTIVYQT